MLISPLLDNIFANRSTLAFSQKQSTSITIYSPISILMHVSDENSLLDPLPKKMRADLAIHVHYKTLSKVALFQVISVAAHLAYAPLL